MEDLPHDAIDPHAEPGTIVAGKFVIEEVIGVGGMGVVVAARHQQLGTRVALKFLKPAARCNPDIVTRFVEEARAAAQLHGEHIARVLDVGTREDGAPYIVMEHLVGHDLAHVIDAPGCTAIHDAAEWVIHACAGLAEAHANQVVHRDVKPENLFLVEGEGWRSIKVLDFGISKAALVDGRHPTPNLVMGSPAYMSPEQLRAEPDVDHRADIWSLGAVLFELLTKTTPYDAHGGVSALARRILEGPPRHLRALRPDAPAALEEIVLACLQKDRRTRFANAAELAIALLPFAPGRARVVAERAAAVTTAAGLAVRELVVPNPDPPPPSARAEKPLSLTTGSAFGTFASVPPPRDTQPTLDDIGALLAPSPRRAVFLGAAGALGALALVAGIVAGRAAPTAPPPVSTGADARVVLDAGALPPTLALDAGALAAPAPIHHPSAPRPAPARTRRARPRP
jgi:eukaryotic-like serine/threonine-protein kinase